MIGPKKFRKIKNGQRTFCLEAANFTFASVLNTFISN
jgi:hypothetical protein